MTAGTDKVIALRDGPVGSIIFNNPARHNAVSVEMWRAVPVIAAEFARDETIRVVVVGGAGGKAFVSGADISEFEQQRSSRQAVIEYQELADAANAALLASTKPTIAAIEGYCIGGGVGIALSCDIRLASDKSRFAIPAAKLGLGYAYPGIARLAGIVGPAFARELFLTGRQFDAAEALQMGLVNRVRPAADFAAYVRDYALAIAENAPLTMASIKQCVAACSGNLSAADLQACQAGIDACFNSADYVEGRLAFMEKRKPVFLGR